MLTHSFRDSLNLQKFFWGHDKGNYKLREVGGKSVIGFTNYKLREVGGKSLCDWIYVAGKFGAHSQGNLLES